MNFTEYDFSDDSNLHLDFEVQQNSYDKMRWEWAVMAVDTSDCNDCIVKKCECEHEQTTILEHGVSVNYIYAVNNASRALLEISNSAIGGILTVESKA